MGSNPSKGACVRAIVASSFAMVLFVFADLATGAYAQAESADWQKLALKSGESVELGTVYWVVNCRSTLVGLPEIEILQGPPQVALSIKEAQVVPRRLGCAATVPGGKLVLTARDISEPVEIKLTYRLKYKTRDGERQTSNTYIVSLFP